MSWEVPQRTTRGFRILPRLRRDFIAADNPVSKGLQALKKIDMDIVVDMRGGHNRKKEAELQKLGMRVRFDSLALPASHRTNPLRGF